ncbi:MAG: tyrosine-protein phosphatase [Dehalococcoidia bacterium]|nr:tyrosine-protein phosphatase [Dehalococcoidia bacterium]
MASLLKSTQNTRALINGSLRYIRSDALTNLDSLDIAWLVHNNVLTVIDLRTEKETMEKPCCLQDYPPFTYLNMPVSFGNEVPQTAKEVPPYYLKMVDHQMHLILSTIENSQTNVIYFCRAGKDRTGVVSALLLLKHGFSHEAIINDYMLSADNLKEMIEQYCSDHPLVSKEAMTPNKEYMVQFLKNLH